MTAIESQMYLCALPKQFWQSSINIGGYSIEIHNLVNDAIGIERRIKKSVNVESERARYNLCCSRIEAAIPSSLISNCATEVEFEAALRSDKFPSETLDKSYLDLLWRLYDYAPIQFADSRISASIFPPDMMSEQIKAFVDLSNEAKLKEEPAIQKRIHFFRLAEAKGCGVVEICNMFSHNQTSSVVTSEPTSIGEEVKLLVSEDGDEEDPGKYQDQDLYDVLIEQVQKAIDISRDGKSLGSVNFSNQPHNVITEVLNSFVYADNPDDVVYIRVVYTDGSQGDPFPLLCVSPPKENRQDETLDVPEFHIALMSMRHQEMDADVDMAWFRNREVSRSRSLGESDNFCYVQSKKQLKETLAEGAVRILLYQTGFQPAVIGFYRALVEELRQRPSNDPQLEVIPNYYSKQAYKPGTPWY